jgi:hypothetical protein
MDAPAPSAAIPDFDLDLALSLLQRVTENDHEIAFPLFLLLRGVVDPKGDPQRYAIADEVMKRAIMMTPQFEEWFRSLVA